MWIRTQGGYLLNMDKVEYVRYSEDMNETLAYAEGAVHAIGYGNMLENVTGAIRCNVTILEVR